jgi:hypothetical protein
MIGIGIGAFQREQQEDDIERITAAIDIIAQENNSTLRDDPRRRQNSEEVMEVAVDVADDPGGKRKITHGACVGN